MWCGWLGLFWGLFVMQRCGSNAKVSIWVSGGYKSGSNKNGNRFGFRNQSGLEVLSGCFSFPFFFFCFFFFLNFQPTIFLFPSALGLHHNKDTNVPLAAGFVFFFFF